MTTPQRQPPTFSSYGSVPLAYSTSTQNNMYSPTKYNPNTQIKDGSLFGPSMESSTYTFSQNLTGTQLVRSVMQESTGPRFGQGDFAFRPNPSAHSLVANLTPAFSSAINTTSVNNQEPFRFTLAQGHPTTQQTTLLPPSQQILKNQHNYSFMNNRSSLKSLQEKRFDQDSNNRNSSPITQFKQQSPQVYRYAENQAYQSVAPLTQYAAYVPTQGQYVPPSPSPQTSESTFQFQRFDTFGSSNPTTNRQTPTFTPSTYNFPHHHLSPSIPQLFSPPPSTTFQPPSSNNLFPSPSPQTTPTTPNLQSRLLNRELTQLKSDQSLKTTVISEEGVQRFPVKFDSHFKEEKDFSGFCGCKGKRVIFDAEEKTPVCW